MDYSEVLLSLEKRIQNAIRKLGPTNLKRWETFCGFDEMTIAQFTERSVSLGISVSLLEIKDIWRKRGITSNIIKYNDFVALLSNWNWSKFTGDFQPLENSPEKCIFFALPENNEKVRNRLFDEFREIDKNATGFVTAEEFDKIALDFSISYDDISRFDTKHDGTLNYLLFLAEISNGKLTERDKIFAYLQEKQKKEEENQKSANISARRIPSIAYLKAPSIDNTGPDFTALSKQNPITSDQLIKEKKEEEIKINTNPLSYLGISKITKAVLEDGRTPTQFFKDISFGGKTSIANIVKELRLTLQIDEIFYITESYGDPMNFSAFMRLISDGQKQGFINTQVQPKDEYVKNSFSATESEIEAVILWLAAHTAIKDFSFLNNCKTAEEASEALKNQSIYISVDDLKPAFDFYSGNLYSEIQKRISSR